MLSLIHIFPLLERWTYSLTRSWSLILAAAIILLAESLLSGAALIAFTFAIMIALGGYQLHRSRALILRTLEEHPKALSLIHI